MDEITLRRFKPEDQDAVHALHVLCLKQVGAYVDNPEMRTTWDKDLFTIEETYLNDKGDFFVALQGADVIGMGALRNFDAHTGEIKRMRVHPDMQGKGVGSMIFNALYARAKEIGYTRLVLDTSTLQIVARQMYEKRGFRLYKEQDLYGQHMLYYEKEI